MSIDITFNSVDGVIIYEVNEFTEFGYDYSYQTFTNCDEAVLAKTIKKAMKLTNFVKVVRV